MKTPKMKVLRINADVLAAALSPPSDPLPPGTVICGGEVPGRAVPWKVGFRNRGRSKTRVEKARERDYQQFVAWQETVQFYARPLMRISTTYRHPVLIYSRFYLHLHPSMPDEGNLSKAFDDALEGLAYLNDRRVAGHDSQLVPIPPQQPERVVFDVLAAAQCGGCGEWIANQSPEDQPLECPECFCERVSDQSMR